MLNATHTALTNSDETIQRTSWTASLVKTANSRFSNYPCVRERKTGKEEKSVREKEGGRER